MECIDYRRVDIKSNLVKKLLNLLGISCLYPIQAEALKEGVEEGESLLVAAPTASGKTLVAMMAIASYLERNKRRRAFYITPLKSIAFEKFKSFEVFNNLGFSVKVSVGDYEKGIPNADIVISTYEKLDSSLRNNPSLLNDLGVLVVDEIHYVGDPDRGPILETLLAKILSLSNDLQIIALSATVPNAYRIAKWIGAKAIVSDWRPVPLIEGVYDERSSRIIFSDGTTKNVFRKTSIPYVDLVKDITDEGGHALVFVQSRKRAVQLAKQASKYKRYLNYDDRLAREYAREISLSNGPRFIREELSQLISSGVAYHHAGLSNELRLVVEEAFRAGALAAIYATPTLAAGVNLPARRVIVAEYYRYESGFKRPISVAEYKQLAGRAGRPGLDERGEAIIIASPFDDLNDIMEYYIKGRPEDVKSRLSGLRGVRHSVLGMIAGGISTKDQVVRVLKRTLYVFEGNRGIEGLAVRALGDLIEWGLVEKEGNVLRLTPVGHEASRFYIDPEGVAIVKELLSKAERISDATLLFIISLTPDMPTFRVSRREADKLVDEALDVMPEVFDLMIYGDEGETSALKAALVLKSWIEEVPEDTILEKYDVWPGDLHMMIETAQWLLVAYANLLEVSSWCKRKEVPQEMKILSQRVKYGVKPELLPLLSIPGIGRVRARRLYNAGFKTLADLARASPKELEAIPGIGPSTVASIMEFFGKNDEAEKYRAKGRTSRRGLLAYMDL
jgi:helicase